MTYPGPALYPGPGTFPGVTAAPVYGTARAGQQAVPRAVAAQWPTTEEEDPGD